MSQFRLVRQFDGKTSTSESRAYRVETTALMTEQEAMQLMRDLGSPYEGKKYQETVPRTNVPVGDRVWGTNFWGNIMSEPTDAHAREIARIHACGLYKLSQGGLWEETS